MKGYLDQGNQQEDLRAESTSYILFTAALNMYGTDISSQFRIVSERCSSFLPFLNLSRSSMAGVRTSVRITPGCRSEKIAGWHIIGLAPLAVATFHPETPQLVAS